MQLKFTGGSLGSNEVFRVKCDLARAESPVMVDYGMGEGWQTTQYQCADCRHSGDGLERIAFELMSVALELPFEELTAHGEVEDSEPHSKHITVTWSEVNGEGRLVARCDDDHTLSSNVVRWSEPINASSDSLAIAEAIAEINGARIVSVDHDNEYVHITVESEMEGTEQC